MTDRTLVMAAIPQELRLLRSLLAESKDESIGRRRASVGELDGRSVVLAEAGIGKVNAAVVTTQLIDRYQPREVLFTGVAGGLDPDLEVGDVVIGEKSIHHDAGVIERGSLVVHQAGHVPFFNPIDRLGYEPSERLLSAARHAAAEVMLEPLSERAGGTGRAPRVVFGTILTGDQFVNDEATRGRLARELGGSAVEMEGAAVAQACEDLGVDCLIVRALSDLAGAESDLDFPRFLDEVAANSAAIVRGVVSRL